MGRVIRNQRKGRGSIFSECDRNEMNIPACETLQELFTLENPEC